MERHQIDILLRSDPASRGAPAGSFESFTRVSRSSISSAGSTRHAGLMFSLACSRKELRGASGWAWSLGILSLLYFGLKSMPRRGQAMVVVVFGTVGTIIGGGLGTIYVFNPTGLS